MYSAGVRVVNPWVSTKSMLIISSIMLIAGFLLTYTGSYCPSYQIESGTLYNRVFGNCSRRLFFSGGKSWYWNGNNGSATTDHTGGNSFVYKTAVAYQPKDREDVIYQKLKESSQSLTGEDNYFIQANAANDVYAGVADGVGGWAEHGYDSSAISRELCKALKEMAATLHKPLTPKQLLDNAYAKIKIDKIVKVGGTTANVAHLSSDGRLDVTNLGDSWCAVFRDSKLVFQTEPQTLGFNTPYQLAIIPDEIQQAAAKNGNRYIQNQPSDADEYNFQLSKGDIVILATDGVTDNIAIEDLELFLRDNNDQLNENLQKTADELVKKVVKISKDPEFPSVFAQEISRLTGKLYKGGKEDDITMVVVKVE